mgnify:CR=1 FL=1
MGFKSGFVKCLFLSLMVLFVGCAELKSLREERIVMNQRVEELQRERDDLDSRYNLSEKDIIFICNNIKKMMNTITEIYIRNTSRSIHNLCPQGSPTTISMRCLICFPSIGFCLYNDSRSEIPIKLSTENFA